MVSSCGVFSFVLCFSSIICYMLMKHLIYIFFLSISNICIAKEALKKRLKELQQRTTHPLTKGPKTLGKLKKPSPLMKHLIFTLAIYFVRSLDMTFYTGMLFYDFWCEFPSAWYSHMQKWVLFCILTGRVLPSYRLSVFSLLLTNIDCLKVTWSSMIGSK